MWMLFVSVAVFFSRLERNRARNKLCKEGQLRKKKQILKSETAKCHKIRVVLLQNACKLSKKSKDKFVWRHLLSILEIGFGWWKKTKKNKKFVVFITTFSTLYEERKFSFMENLFLFLFVYLSLPFSFSFASLIDEMSQSWNAYVK